MDNSKELNDYKLGYLKGKLYSLKGMSKDEVLENETNLEARKGIEKYFNTQYRNALRLKVSDFAKTLKAYLKDSSIENYKNMMQKLHQISDEELDKDRLLLTNTKDGEPEIVEKYNKDELKEVQKRLEEDDTLELKSADIDGDVILVGKKSN